MIWYFRCSKQMLMVFTSRCYHNVTAAVGRASHASSMGPRAAGQRASFPPGPRRGLELHEQALLGFALAARGTTGFARTERDGTTMPSTLLFVSIPANTFDNRLT